jgi:protein YIPF5/7
MRRSSRPLSTQANHAASTAVTQQRLSQPRPVSSAIPTTSYYNPVASNPSVAGPTTFYPTANTTSKPAAAQEDDDDWYTDGNTAPPPVPVANSARPPPHRSSSLGAMEGGDTNPSVAWSAPAAAMAPNFFVPTAAPLSGNAPALGGAMISPVASSDIDPDEPPLLEELGIHLDHIAMKVKAVIVPSERFHSLLQRGSLSWLSKFGPSASLTPPLHANTGLIDPKVIVEDPDLAGPVLFALCLGAELLLSGKIQFGYIYGFGLFGCLAMTLVINLLCPQAGLTMANDTSTTSSGGVSVWAVTSILGYSLIPVNILAALKLLLMNILKFTSLGKLLACVAVLWSTTAATRLFEAGFAMRDQRYLIAYPLALLYSAFVLITIF